LARLSLFDGDWAPAAAGLQQGRTPFWTLAQDFVFLVLFSSCSGVICAMHNTDCRPVIVRIASCYWTFLTANASTLQRQTEPSPDERFSIANCP
jgi:hypothetical protein